MALPSVDSMAIDVAVLALNRLVQLLGKWVHGLHSILPIDHSRNWIPAGNRLGAYYTTFHERKAMTPC